MSFKRELCSLFDFLVMILGGEESVEMKVEGFILEQVKSSKYLEVPIQNNGKQEAGTNERISTAMKMYYTPIKNVLRMRTITKKIEVNV